MRSIIKKKRINEVPISVPNVSSFDGKGCEGAHMFKDPYAFAFLCSKRGSGKTNIIYNLTDSCVSPITIIISGSVQHDQLYQKMIKNLESKGSEVSSFNSLKDDDGNDVLSMLLDSLDEKALLEKEAEEEEKRLAAEEKKVDNNLYLSPWGVDTDVLSQSILPTESKVRYKWKGRGKGKKGGKVISDFDDNGHYHNSKGLIVPTYTIIIDDIGVMMRSESVSLLGRKGRQYKIRVILSSQHSKDINVSARVNLTDIIIFSSFSADRLDHIREELGLGVDKDELLAMYQDATKVPYSFIHIDTKVNDVYHGFDFKYEIDKNKVRDEVTDVEIQMA